MNNAYITKENNINYRALSDLRTFLKGEIKTVDEYVDWVREWKEQEKLLVAAIRHFRTEKNNAKLAKDGYQCNVMQGRKLSYRGIATAMYEKRVENKAALKAGVFKETEIA